MSQFERLVEIMARLRGPGGCPWDQEQTHQSLKPYLIEEAYELLDAIDAEDDVDIREELGDVLLQVVFHSQLASENKQFTIEEVAETICSKLVRRHPHVFGDVSVAGTADVLKNWEAIKSREKEERGQDASVLSGVPRHLPGLLRALRMQEKAAKVGFDWKHTEEVAGKVREEVEEFLEAHSENDAKKMEEELGDLLFSLVNLARFLHI
ncbi:MAG: nucleoside triphosphate pyrophosphohydrolase, partial [bacterium]|nr:nucleoside triphosphate pyrophosphohydrolase [bacterium]